MAKQTAESAKPLEGRKPSRVRDHAEKIDERLSESTGEPRGTFITILLTLFQELLPKLLTLLPCFNPKPVPVDPVPNPSEARKLAWQNAWRLKGRAEEDFDEATNDYKAHTLRQMSVRIRRAKRKDGEPVTKEESFELAKQALDAARETPHEEMVETILEAQGK
jgi:hypothetical protein